MSNIEKIEQKIQEKHQILQRHNGKLVAKGRFAGKICNIYWRVQNKETDEIYYIMLCGNNVLTYISNDNIDEVIKHNTSWYYNKNLGYIIAGNGNREYIYLHAFITKHQGNGKGGDSVDHLNRKKLDNRKSNLEVKKCGENTSNTQKRQRQKNAIPLPSVLGINNLPKYCEYRPEFYPQTKNLKRDFFLINNHPNLEKSSGGKKNWTTTKSVDVSITQKYKDLIEKLKKIDPYYENDMISVEELHKEFFVENINELNDDIDEDINDDIDVDIKIIDKKENKGDINTLLKIGDNISKKTIQNKPLILKKNEEKEKISIQQTLEILKLKRKNKNKESFDNGVKITRESICEYYKENNIINTLTINMIDKIWNKQILKNEDFEINNLDITYEEYIELVNSKNRINK